MEIFSTTILFLFTRPNGLTFEYLWPNTGALDATSGPIVASIGMLTALLFFIQYFNLEKDDASPKHILESVCCFASAYSRSSSLTPPPSHRIITREDFSSRDTHLDGCHALGHLQAHGWSGRVCCELGLFIICGVVYASWLQGYSSNFYAAGYLIKLSAIVQAAGLSYSARRRIQRSQELSLETKQAIETVRKIQQVNQLNDLLHSLGHELANPIGVVQLAHEEIQTRLA